jgi:hypothetical protein
MINGQMAFSAYLVFCFLSCHLFFLFLTGSLLVIGSSFFWISAFLGITFVFHYLFFPHTVDAAWDARRRYQLFISSFRLESYVDNSSHSS